MSNFPTSVSTDANLYVAVNGLQTTLSAPALVGDLTLTLTSTTGFPATGAVTVDNNEVVFYTGVSGADLTGCTRGADGTTAVPHNAGVTVGLTVVAAHHNRLKDEVIAIETALGATFTKGNLTSTVGTDGITVTGGTGAVIGSGASISQQAATDAVPGYLTAADHSSFNTTKLPLAGGTMTGDITMDNDKAIIFKETTVNGTDSVTVKAPASVTTSYTVQLPPTVASAGQVLTDAAGNGVLSWVSPAASGGWNDAGTYVTLDTSTDQVRIGDGAVGTPGLSFISDTNSGLYRIGADNIGVAVNATKIIDVGVANTFVANAFNVRQTVVGGDVTSSVMNQDNTNSASRAYAEIVSGGSSAGDAVLSMQINGAGAVIMGIDNSDSDAFEVCTGSVVGSNVAVKVNTSTSAVAIKGTTTNDSASAGYVGEYVESVVFSVAVPATTIYGDATSISLTSGDWDVSLVYNIHNGTVTEANIGISVTSGNSGTGLVYGSNLLLQKNAVNLNTSGASIASYRMSLTGTTTVYAKMYFIYSVAPTFSTKLSARRIR
jgi:hypothetical protein